MNDRFLKATGISLAAFIVMFAANGKAFIDALLGVPALISAWSAPLPFGAWSAVISLVVSIVAWAFARRWATYLRHGKADDPGAGLFADTLALMTGATVTVVQAWGQPRGSVLMALWVGIAAGFLGPYLARMIAAGYRSRTAP